MSNPCITNKYILLFAATIIFAMLINVFHPFLWGPDEPRVAEIAREAYIGGNYITPHLCGLPFVEKPPLYFDLVAWCYALNGGAEPGIGRLVSALLGCIMLAACFWAAYRWGGLRRAVFASMLLITMPQFYRAAHWIITDIGVGAFCSLALCLFLYYEFWQGKDTKYQSWTLALFYLASAGAFLTKGLVGIFHIGVIIGAYILIRQRWDLLRRMLSPLCILMFLIPVCLWVFWFYREGGIYFLHEHFINNTIGRFLHMQFKMQGSQLAFTDIGNSSPWYFYLQRSPVMFGAAIAFLPLILWDGLRKINILPDSWVVYSTEIKKRDNNWKCVLRQIALLLLNGKKNKISDSEKNLETFLLLWAFLPVFVLSFSSIKEVTYILPSYVGIAILCAAWLDERITKPDTSDKAIVIFSIAVIPVCVASFILAPISAPAYIIAVSIWMAAGLPFVITYACKLRFMRMAVAIAGIVLCGVILGNTPEVMRKTGLNRKCHIDLAKYVFDKVGDRKFYVFGGCETIRSSMPFYGNRQVPTVTCVNSLKKILSEGKGCYVIIIAKCLKRMLSDKELSRIIEHCKCEQLPFNKLSDDYILIAAPDKTHKNK